MCTKVGVRKNSLKFVSVNHSKSWHDTTSASISKKLLLLCFRWQFHHIFGKTKLKMIWWYTNKKQAYTFWTCLYRFRKTIDNTFFKVFPSKTKDIRKTVRNLLCLVLNVWYKKRARYIMSFVHILFVRLSLHCNVLHHCLSLLCDRILN